MADEQLYTGEEIRAKGFNPDTVSSIGGKFRLSQFGGATGTSGVVGGSQEDTIRRAIEMQREAAQPAIQSLQAGIPEVQQATQARTTQLEAEKAPLTARYENLINTIKQTGQRATEQQTRITSGELGKRGIVGSSTLAQQELQNVITPLTEKYLGLEKDTSLERESSLRDLVNQITNVGLSGTEQQRSIQNAIAQLQAGAGASGITTGISQYGTQQAQLRAQQEAERQAKLDALTKRIYEETTLPQSQYAINKPYYKADSSSDNGGWE